MKLSEMKTRDLREALRKTEAVLGTETPEAHIFRRELARRAKPKPKPLDLGHVRPRTG